jgi:hypothetical protein
MLGPEEHARAARIVLVRQHHGHPSTESRQGVRCVWYHSRLSMCNGWCALHCCILGPRARSASISHNGNASSKSTQATGDVGPLLVAEPILLDLLRHVRALSACSPCTIVLRCTLSCAAAREFVPSALIFLTKVITRGVCLEVHSLRIGGTSRRRAGEGTWKPPDLEAAWNARAARENV